MGANPFRTIFLGLLVAVIASAGAAQGQTTARPPVGGFGSPTIFLDKTDMYFGNDRLPLIRDALTRRK